MKSIGVVAALAVAVAAASLSLWDCPTCGRASKPARCPCCGDAGRVSWLIRARRAPSDPRLLALFKDPRDIPQALGALLEMPPDVELLNSVHVQFALCDGEDVVIALVNQSRISARVQRAEAWMFNDRGGRLDHVMAIREIGAGGAAFSFGLPETELWLLTNPGGRGVTLWPDGGPPELLRSPAELDPYRYFRFRLAKGRFERVPP
jgi:hypothetical protein